jgi:hypothetical protein
MMNLTFDDAEGNPSFAYQAIVDESPAPMLVQGRIGATQTSPVKATAAANAILGSEQHLLKWQQVVHLQLLPLRSQRHRNHQHQHQQQHRQHHAFHCQQRWGLVQKTIFSGW